MTTVRLILSTSIVCGLLEAAVQIAPAQTPSQAAVTFDRDIAPLIYRECSGCHRPSQAGPFNLLTYADVKKRAHQVVKVTTDRFMPPWLPAPGYGEFKDERRLTSQEIALIQAWVENGAPEGNAADLPPLPHWTEGWQWGTPDLVLTLPEPYLLPEVGADVWRAFVIRAPLPTNRYVRAIEFRPENKCVHHASMRLDSSPQSRLRDAADPGPGFGGITLPETARPPAGHMLNWLPGRIGYRSPPGMAWPFPKGADMVMQLHMQTTGKPEKVQPRIGLYFTDEPPTNQLSVFPLMVRTLDIPAGRTDYRARDSYRLPIDAELLWVNPHAHYLGRELKGYARLPDGSQRWLFLIKQWDFNWQGDYSYRVPIFLPKGTELFMDYTFDNSTNNLHNPSHPPQRVQFGQQSTNEMAELWFQVLPRNRKDRITLERDFQGKTLAEMNDYYEFVLQRDPANAYAHCRLGFAKMLQRRDSEAIQHLQRAVELDAHSDEPHLYLGMLWLNQDRFAPAQAELEAAVRINPDNYLAHGNLGLLHMNQGQLPQAEQHLRAALQLNPNDRTAQENLAQVLRAGAPKAEPR